MIILVVCNNVSELCATCLGNVCCFKEVSGRNEIVMLILQYEWTIEQSSCVVYIYKGSICAYVKRTMLLLYGHYLWLSHMDLHTIK